MPGPGRTRDSEPQLLTLTARDEDLIQALTGRFRLITVPLVACLWSSSEAYVRRRLSQLDAAGLLTATRVLAHPLLDLSEPVARWRPGDPEPDFGAVSYRLKARWTLGPKRTTVYLPTRRAVHLFGGAGGRFDYPLQATHDLHIAALYVRLATTRPEEADHWRGEEMLRLARTRGRGKVCDAVIVNEREKPIQAIEFGGSYRADRVRAFHRVMANRRLGYDLW